MKVNKISVAQAGLLAVILILALGLLFVTFVLIIATLTKFVGAWSLIFLVLFLFIWYVVYTEGQ